jgi:hypothetical protein
LVYKVFSCFKREADAIFMYIYLCLRHPPSFVSISCRLLGGATF